MSSTQTAISTRSGTSNAQPAQQRPRAINVGTIERRIALVAGTLLTLYGLRRLDVWGIVLALLGGSADYRAVTGHSFLYQALGVSTLEKKRSSLICLPEHQGIRVRKSMTVNRSAESLYQFWDRVENMPLFMKYVESVTSSGDHRSHWLAKAPITGAIVEWDSEVTVDQENRYIAWRTLGETPFAHASSVRFEPALYGHETVVTLTMDFYRRGGPIVEAITKFLGYVPEHLTQEALRSFKELMEAGEIARAESRPTASANREAAHSIVQQEI
jgi:uncharacterized membrane protein